MFRFTIRKLVLVTAMAALAVGWGVDHWRLGEMISNWEWRAKALARAAKDSGMGTVIWNSTDFGFEVQSGDGLQTVYPAPIANNSKSPMTLTGYTAIPTINERACASRYMGRGECQSLILHNLHKMHKGNRRIHATSRSGEMTYGKIRRPEKKTRTCMNTPAGRR